MAFGTVPKGISGQLLGVTVRHEGHGDDFGCTFAARLRVVRVEDDAAHGSGQVGWGDLLGSEGDRRTGPFAHGGVLVVVGALRKDHLRYPVCQGAEGRARSTVVHDRAARREQIRLRDELFDSYVRGKGCQLARI